MLYQMDLFGKPASEEPTYYRSPHRVAYPGTSKSSKSRLIETHTNSLKHLLAKDGVIYKEAMAIVAEDIKKIISEEMLLFDTFLNSYSRPTRRPLRRSRSPHLPRGPNLAPARCPSTLSQSSLISVLRYAPESAACMHTHTHIQHVHFINERKRTFMNS